MNLTEAEQAIVDAAIPWLVDGDLEEAHDAAVRVVNREIAMRQVQAVYEAVIRRERSA